MEKIIGFPVLLTASINGISVISNEAILNAGAFSLDNSLTALASNGVLKHSIFMFFC